MGYARQLAVTLAIAGVGMATAPRPARAQFAPPSGAGAGAAPTTGVPAATYGNPYTNPYTNPFMNPYMMQAPVQGNVGLYLFAAQSANGGIGSGQLSGTRPARGTAASAGPATAPPASPATESMRPSIIAGGGAARYFNRAYQQPGISGRYYNRQARYYSRNGR